MRQQKREEMRRNSARFSSALLLHSCRCAGAPPYLVDSPHVDITRSLT